MTIRPVLWALAFGVVVALGAADAQQTPRPPAKPHSDHGTPAGWKFKWPKGDPAKGRQVFTKFGCFSCHEVKGEKFPAPTDKGKVGPELSMMGPLHDAMYFAEATINPSATIEPGRSYAGADGSSKMPSDNDSMLVQEVVDLVAFLSSLKPGGTTPAGHFATS